MKENPLTEAVLRYQQNGEGKKELIDAIALKAYRIAHRKADWDEDDAGDFFCHFLPKIPGLIDSYRDKGSSFEVYLHVHLLWSIRGYAKRLKHRRYESTLNTYDTFWEVHERRPEDAFDTPTSIPEEFRRIYKIDENGSLTDSVWKQRFIFLILREAEYLDHCLIENIVTATGVNRKWLMNCVVRLKERIEIRRRRLETLRSKRNYWFYRYYLLQIRIADTYEIETRRKLLEELELIRQKFHRAAERVIRLHTHPTNLDIAQVLNIPKGSIDSGIHYVMRKYHQLQSQSEPEHSEPLSGCPHAAEPYPTEQSQRRAA